MTHVVQLKVESTGVTHRLSVSVASPQSCRARMTVGTKRSRPLADNLKNRNVIFQLLQSLSSRNIMSFSSPRTARRCGVSGSYQSFLGPD